MKIIIVHQYFNVTKGGFRTYSFAKYLVKKGHSVVVITSNREHSDWGKFESQKIDGIDIIYIRNRYSNTMSFGRRIVSFLRFMLLSVIAALKVKDADLIYTTSTPLTVGIAGIAYKMKYKKPFVFEVRDLWPELPIAMGVIKNKILVKFLKYFERKVYFSADRIIALSPGMQEGIVSTGYPKEKTIIISNGCDIDILNSGNSNKFEIPGVQNSDLKLIYAGNFGLANGLDYIIEFAKYVKNKNIFYIKFILIGDGMKKIELKKLVADNNLTNVLIFDYMPKDLVKKYIKSADIGLQILADIPAFYYGTSPNKFFDYIALAKPVLNNYPGWLADMISENNCGCVVDNNNFEDTLIKLESYRNNKETLVQQGENAFALAKKEFDRIKLAEKLESLFVDIISIKN